MKEATEKTRSHILEIARRRFYKKGFAATSINEIVDAADVTKPTVYYHFKSKEGLFVALVRESYDFCYENRRAAVDENAPVSEQIFQVIAADFDFCRREPELLQFVLSLTFALPDEQTADLNLIHTRDYEFYRTIIERGIERGEIFCADVVTAALALQGSIAINVMSYLKMRHESEFLSDQRAREIAAVFLNGVTRRETI